MFLKQYFEEDVFITVELSSQDELFFDIVPTAQMETLDTWDTEYSADSVEWCPLPPHERVFVCGTYQITQEESANNAYTRLGRLYLLEVDSRKKMRLLQTLETPAILDTKWCSHRIDNMILLAVANAAGNVQIYQLNTEPYSLSIICSLSVANSDAETLALSLDWSPKSSNIVVSDSKGCVSLLKFCASSLHLSDSWKLHDFEAWIAAFDYWNESVAYSGGDDCKLNVLDLRMGTRRLLAKCDAGVTSLHSNLEREFVLASGSYDENLRLWDVRSTKQPMSCLSLGGGVWRLKWDPHRWQHLLAACMHGGFCIVNDKPSITTTYMEHGSLAYGADWCVDMTSKFVATCSFYDHKLCLSQVALLN